MLSFWSIVNDLPKEQLIDLLYEYDKYLEYAREEDSFHDGWIPVSVSEFYEVEFQMLIEERSTRDQSNEEGSRPDYSTFPELDSNKE